MRSALIIGADGQDGRLLARLLAQRNYAVRGWTRCEPRNNPHCVSSVVDILSLSQIEEHLRRFQPNEIYYLAAFHHSTENIVPISLSDLFRRSFDVHVNGVLNVLTAMNTLCPEARLFYAASSHVFGQTTTREQNEATPLRPESPYAISKAAGLRCCQLFRERDNLFTATGILFNHESALRNPTFVSQKIVRGALQAQRDPSFRLELRDLDARADWGYAPDYVDAMFRILQLEKGNDYVIASGELHSVREFAELAFQEVGLDWRNHVIPSEQFLKRNSYPLRGDASRLRYATDWAPTVDFGQLVRKLVRETKEAYASI